MNIRATLGFNLIDYPGKVAAVAFSAGCNYRCPACHAAPVLKDGPSVSEEDFMSYLSGVRRWIDGVVLCGGEPTLQPDLRPFIARLKAERLSVKLDTNGSSPELLKSLLSEGLLDYVAMDVKGPKELWPALCGKDDAEGAIMESLRIVAGFAGHEFRTTVVPVLRENEPASFLTAPEIGQTAKLIAAESGACDHRYYVQKFVPRKNGLLDSRLESFPETPLILLQEACQAAAKHLPSSSTRG